MQPSLDNRANHAGETLGVGWRFVPLRREDVGARRASAYRVLGRCGRLEEQKRRWLESAETIGCQVGEPFVSVSIVRPC